MRRSLAPLLILLVVQVLLAGALYLRRDPLAAARSDALLLPAEAVHAADRIAIDAPAPAPTHVVLQKKDGSWVLPDAYGVPADSARVTALEDQLAGLKRGLPIATSDAAMRRFKVTDTDFERRLELSGAGKPLVTLFLGSSPGLRKSDARTGSDRAVYAVDMPTYELPADVGSWLSPDLLRVDAAGLTGMTTSEGRETVQLTRPKAAESKAAEPKGADRPPEGWTGVDLKAGEHLDSAHVAALVQQLASLRAQSVLGTTVQPEWQQEHPVLTVTLRDGKSQDLQWVLSKPSSGDFYVLKSSAHPWYFSISTATGQSLVEAAARSALIPPPVKAGPPAKGGATPTAGSGHGPAGGGSGH